MLYQFNIFPKVKTLIKLFFETTVTRYLCNLILSANRLLFLEGTEKGYLRAFSFNQRYQKDRSSLSKVLLGKGVLK